MEIIAAYSCGGIIKVSKVLERKQENGIERGKIDQLWSNGGADSMGYPNSVFI